MFELHPRLRQDAAAVVKLDLCLVLLMHDCSFPWLILVPRRAGLREIHDLSKAERNLLMDEICVASRIMDDAFKPDKINIGALGNIVEQLHVHVIGRFATDRAWPGPVWGSGAMQAYGADELQKTVRVFQAAFKAAAR